MHLLSNAPRLSTASVLFGYIATEVAVNAIKLPIEPLLLVLLDVLSNLLHESETTSGCCMLSTESTNTIELSPMGLHTRFYGSEALRSTRKYMR